MQKQPHTSTSTRFNKSTWLATPLAIFLAAGMAGCEHGSSTIRSSANFNTQDKAQMSTAVINPSETYGAYTSESYIQEASEFNLPQQWVSEARAGTAEIQAVKANAQAYELVAGSNYDEASAQADTDLQEAFILRDSGYADAERTNAIHNARLSSMGSQIEARKVQNETKWDRQEAFLTASVNEWQSEINRMRSESEREWSDALAEHDRMMATYTAVESRGQAEIDQMTKAADLTEDRAASKVQNFRTEAQSVAEKSQAEVDNLNQLISTTTEQTNATVANLVQKGQSLEGEMSSQIAMINAQANQFEAADAEENYTLEIEAAQVSYQTAVAEAQNIKLDANEQATFDNAMLTRQTSDAHAEFTSAKTSYDRIEKMIKGQFDKALADIQNIKARAVHQEKIARADFINAEIDARVAAMREQATHDRSLAENELKQIEAEAYAFAKDLQADMTREFAKQMEKGSFVIPGNDTPQEKFASNDDQTPTLAKSDTKPANIEIDRVAAFRVGLAKAAQFNQHAQADRLDAIAMRDAEIAKLDNWWSAQQADHNATMASINTFKLKSDADVSRMLTQSESMIANAETERTRSLVDAESGRTEVLATIETLRGNSQTLESKKSAKVKQLFAQAEATKRIGESKVASLSVQRDSTARRGDAMSAQLLAEASSLEQSQRAVVAQMRKEIESSRQILTSELARLNQAATSYYQIAEANYNEGISMAQSFERIAIANTTELTARHIAARKQNQADVEYMHHLTSAAELMRDAEVTRMYAQADEAIGYKKAEDIATRGQIEADQAIALASSVREFTVAEARESGVRARFDQRIVMTQADRNRSYADVYAQGQQQIAHNEMAAAQAATYAELSQVALARLNAASESFQKTAQRNWDSRLAMPTTFNSPTDINTLYESSEQTFDFGEFVTVPTDFE